MNNVNTLIKELLNEKFNSEDLKSHNAIAAIILDDSETKILLLDHVKFNFFTIPIGKVKDTETVEEALKIELFEELGIKVIEYDEIEVVCNEYERPTGRIKVNEHIFLITKYKGNILNKEKEKHRSINWYSFQDALKMNISTNTRSMLIKLINSEIP